MGGYGAQKLTSSLLHFLIFLDNLAVWCHVFFGVVCGGVLLHIIAIKFRFIVTANIYVPEVAEFVELFFAILCVFEDLSYVATFTILIAFNKLLMFFALLFQFRKLSIHLIKFHLVFGS